MGNQDINAKNVEIWNFVSKFDMDGLIGYVIQQVPIILLFQVLKNLFKS